MVDPFLILTAFACGLGVTFVGLPPLVGFLLAGFGLNAAGYEVKPGLEQMAEVGVTVLLFTIGLKLRVKDLLRPEIWGAATAHMAITTVLGAGLGLLAAVVGLSMFAGLDLGQCLLLAFALSFSSTVFAVKALEEKGVSNVLYGRTAIGVLIMQDLFAVGFLVAAAGKYPTWWALLLPPAFMLARPLLMYLISKVGHGELLILLGILLVFCGVQGFTAVGLKGDLGAIAIGVLVAAHPKASELAKALLSFKDLFLVGFFLSIGLSAPPTWQALGVAVLFLTLVPFKVALFIVLFQRFKLRTGTAVFGGLLLGNYSEFGLIVTSVGVSRGWIGPEWLVAMAIAVSLTFVLGAPLNTHARRFAEALEPYLGRFQTQERHPEERPIDLQGARALVCGMGSTGCGAYDELRKRMGDVVIGFDADPDIVEKQLAAGRRVVIGKATDISDVERTSIDGVELILLALPNHNTNLRVIKLVRGAGFRGRIVAVADFKDEAVALRAAGANAAYESHREAGEGLASAALRTRSSGVGV